MMSINASVITLPAIGTYILGGKVYCTSSSTLAGTLKLNSYTSINSGSSWTVVNAGNSPAGVGDIGIYGLITTSVVNQQCKITLSNGMNAAITLSNLYTESFCYVYKIAPY